MEERSGTMDSRHLNEHGDQGGDDADTSISIELILRDCFDLMRQLRETRPALTPDAGIAADAEKASQESFSAFTSFIIKKATEKCQSENPEMVTKDDVFSVLTAVGFDDYLLRQRLGQIRGQYGEKKGDKGSKTSESGEGSSGENRKREEERGVAPELVAPEYRYVPPPVPALAVDPNCEPESLTVPRAPNVTFPATAPEEQQWTSAVHGYDASVSRTGSYVARPDAPPYSSTFDPAPFPFDQAPK